MALSTLPAVLSLRPMNPHAPAGFHKATEPLSKLCGLRGVFGNTPVAYHQPVGCQVGIARHWRRCPIAAPGSAGWSDRLPHRRPGAFSAARRAVADRPNKRADWPEFAPRPARCRNFSTSLSCETIATPFALGQFHERSMIDAGGRSGNHDGSPRSRSRPARLGGGDQMIAAPETQIFIANAVQGRMRRAEGKRHRRFLFRQLQAQQVRQARPLVRAPAAARRGPKMPPGRPVAERSRPRPDGRRHRAEHSRPDHQNLDPRVNII